MSRRVFYLAAFVFATLLTEVAAESTSDDTARKPDSSSNLTSGAPVPQAREKGRTVDFKYYTIEIPNDWKYHDGGRRRSIAAPDGNLLILPQGILHSSAKSHANASLDKNFIAGYIDQARKVANKLGHPMIQDFATKELSEKRSISRGAFRLNASTIIVQYYVIGPTYIVSFVVASKHGFDSAIAKLDPIFASVEWVGKKPLARDASVTADLSALRARYGDALAHRVANEFMPVRRKILARALYNDPRKGDCGPSPDFKVTRIVPVPTPEISPDKARLWTERIELSCGGGVARNFLMALKLPDVPGPGVILTPGETLADFRTQLSIIPKISAAALLMTEAKKRGCQRPTILDTRVTKPPSPGVEPRQWSERWSLDVCGEAFTQSVVFTQEQGKTAGFVIMFRKGRR